MYNLSNLVSQFRELSELTQDDYFRSRSYGNAAIILADMDSSEFADREDFTDIYGIGSSINNKILQYKDHGIIDKLQTLRAERANDLDPNQYKVRDGFITKKISHDEATNLVSDIRSVIGNSDKFIIAGSYRRCKSLVGDLDMLVPARSYAKVCRELLKAGYDEVSHGDYKSQYLIDPVNNIPMDVISYTADDKIYQLLYLTGSRDMNIRMRRQAARNGMLLNQYGLYYRGTEDLVISKAKSEEDVFKALDMKYVAPELR